MIVDDQPWRRPREPALAVSLIDPDLQLAGLPLVFEGLSMQEWYENDGWVDTVKDDLEGVT